MSDLTMQEKILKKFTELKDEGKVDTSVDKVNLENSFNITMNLQKWITKKTEWLKVNRDFDEKRKKQYRELYMFYVNDFPLKLDTKAEFTMFIESDPGYTECYNNFMLTKDVIQFIDSTIDNLKTKNWEIKAIIEWRKFQNGQ